MTQIERRLTEEERQERIRFLHQLINEKLRQCFELENVIKKNKEEVIMHYEEISSLWESVTISSEPNEIKINCSK